MQTDRKMHMTKLIVTFRNFANAPKMNYVISRVTNIKQPR